MHYDHKVFFLFFFVFKKKKKRKKLNTVRLRNRLPQEYLVAVVPVIVTISHYPNIKCVCNIQSNVYTVRMMLLHTSCRHSISVLLFSVVRPHYKQNVAEQLVLGAPHVSCAHTDVTFPTGIRANINPTTLHFLRKLRLLMLVKASWHISVDPLFRVFSVSQL